MCACVQRAPGGRQRGRYGVDQRRGKRHWGKRHWGERHWGERQQGATPPAFVQLQRPSIKGRRARLFETTPPSPPPRMGVFAWAAYSTQTKSMVPHYCAAFNTCTRFSCSFFTPPTFPPPHTHTATAAFTHGLPPPTPPIPTGMTTPRRSAFS